MERSQGEIKRYLRAILKDREELDAFTVAVHLSVERANRRRRAVLAGKSAQERWEEEFSHFTRYIVRGGLSRGGGIVYTIA